MLRHSLLALIAVASVAAADPLNGTVEPSLRRKVQLVYLEKVAGDFPPPAESAVVTQRGNTYLPAVLPVLAGTKISFRSEDPELHNVYARGPKKVMFNQAQTPKMVFEKTFSELGAVHLTCNIHKEMSAWVVVLQNPYFAAPDPKTGAFTIENVPPGSYTLRLFGEKLDEDELGKKVPVTVGKDAPRVEVRS